MSYLQELAKIAPPNLIDLDQDSFINEIVQKIKENPDWESQWDGELSQNAAWAFINYFAWMHSKAAEATNRTTRESFITQARDPLSVVDHLNDYGVSLKQNTEAVVDVTGTVAAGFLTQNLTIQVGQKLTAQGLDGSEVIFEIIKKDIADPSKYDYESDTVIPAGTSVFTVEAFAGETFRLDIVLNPPADSEKFIINIDRGNIIDGSIRAYYEFDNPLLRTELIKTRTFVVPQVITPNFPNGVPHYKEKFSSTGSAQLIFGTATFGGAFPTGGPINVTVFGRTGGGVASNIVQGAINETLSFQLNANNLTNINFTNEVEGQGGSEKESILEAQFFAPHRIGRNSSIVSDEDALNEFSTRALKHVVESPKYSELGANVPILHYHNYVAPPRDYSTFVLPSVSVGDDAASYAARLMKSLNTFLNLGKIHDQLLEDEIVSFFLASDFDYVLEYNPPLNGSLYLSAYDTLGREIDRIKFLSNYSGSTNSPTTPDDVATVACANAFVPVTITASLNDKLKFSIDEIDPLNVISGAGTDFTITIPPGLYGTAQTLAAAIDTEIHAAHAFFSANPSYEYCFVNDEGKISIRSKTSGEWSRVIISAVADDCYATIGLAEQVARALPQSGQVFEQTTNYDLTNNTVNVKLNSDRFEEDYTEPSNLTGWPDSASADGPEFDFVLEEEDMVTQAYAQVGTTMTVRAVHSISTAILDEVIFSSIAESASNVGSLTGPNSTGNVFDDAVPGYLNFDYFASQIHLKLLDSTDPGPVYGFPPGYDTNLEFQIIYSRKGYDVITATYYPNPYKHEGETALFASVLRGADKKMICMEPIFKRVDFVPVKVQATLVPKKSKNPTQAIIDTINLIHDRFGYSNIDPDNTIGEGFNTSKLRGILNENVTLNKNVKKVTVLQPSDDVDPTLGKYYFVMPQNMIDRLIQLEQANPQIAGLVDMYRPDVSLE